MAYIKIDGENLDGRFAAPTVAVHGIGVGTDHVQPVVRQASRRELKLVFVQDGKRLRSGHGTCGPG